MNAGNIADDSDSVAEAATKRLYPKTHANYWKARLEHRTYTSDEKTVEVAECLSSPFLPSFGTSPIRH
jgi:hypothetical protein